MEQNRYHVAVVHHADIEAAVARGLDLMGGLARYVCPGMRVVIKVNMFVRAAPESARTTHPAVALAVAQGCRACGADVTVVERAPHFEFDFGPYYAPLQQVARVVSLDSAPHRHMPLPGARSLRYELPWPTLIDDCDFFINIPGLRTHALPKFSNGMKNLMGLLPGNTTRLVHQHGLDGSICDINAYRPSDLVVTEAVYTLEGNFPSEGDPVRTDVITVADNVVAADLVAARLMGIDAAEVFYLQEAIARGLGPADLSEVALLGDDLATVCAGMHIAPAPRDPEPEARQHTLHIANACASCRQALAGGLLAASHRSHLAAMEGVTILAGHQDQAPTAAAIGDGPVLAYGNCAYRYRHLGHYEPGCPPLSGQVINGLEALLPKTARPILCLTAWGAAPVEEAVAAASAAGYAGLECWGSHLARHAAEHGGFEGLAAQLGRAGLSVAVVNGYFDPAVDLEGSLAAARRDLDAAAALGAPLLGVYLGRDGDGSAPIGAWRAAVAGLQQLCDLATERGLTLALAAPSGPYCDSTAHTLRLLRQVARPNLAVALDACALFRRGEEPVRALQQLLPWVRMVRLANARLTAGEIEPASLAPASLAAGDLDYAPFLAALAAANYGGDLAVEWFPGQAAESPGSPAATAEGELAYLRHILGSRLEGGA
jgi:uncharacterized protein (DUF362 family)/sugar phosphate isomerase/epimerase